MIRIVVNGQERTLEGPTTVEGLLNLLGLQSRFVAVARNGEVVPRDAYATVPVQDGDVLEIVRPVGGG